MRGRQSNAHLAIDHSGSRLVAKIRKRGSGAVNEFTGR
jgi:hypothetical protein